MCYDGIRLPTTIDNLPGYVCKVGSPANITGVFNIKGLPMSNEKCFLWVNAADLSQMGNIGPFGSPLKMMVLPNLGDKLLDIALYDVDRMDNLFAIVECTPDRAIIIEDALIVIGKAKIKRAIRTRITKELPTTDKKYKQVRFSL